MGISALKSPDTGHQVGNAKGKANIPNHQFQSAFTTETLVTEAHAKPQLFPNITDIYFTENGILKLLSGLGPSKACGPDQPVLPRVLKELATQEAPILTDLLNRSYQLGSVSNYCRHANVSPVYKKVKQILAVNYRPISLICVCCKIFEHFIASATMSHAQKHNILYAPQHDFRSKLSCETQLVEFVRDLSENMYDGHQTNVLIMDFSKAFDKVGHQRSLSKLQGYDITAQTHQRPGGTTGFKSMLFADDAIAYLTVDSQTDAMALQHDLNLLVVWERTWQMEFHPDKCQVLRVINKKSANIITQDYILHSQTLTYALMWSTVVLLRHSKPQWWSILTSHARHVFNPLLFSFSTPVFSLYPQANTLCTSLLNTLPSYCFAPLLSPWMYGVCGVCGGGCVGWAGGWMGGGWVGWAGDWMGGGVYGWVGWGGGGTVLPLSSYLHTFISLHSTRHPDSYLNMNLNQPSSERGLWNGLAAVTSTSTWVRDGPLGILSRESPPGAGAGKI